MSDLFGFAGEFCFPLAEFGLLVAHVVDLFGQILFCLKYLVFSFVVGLPEFLRSTLCLSESSLQLLQLLLLLFQLLHGVLYISML